MNEKILRLNSKRDHLMHAKRLAKLRADLIEKMGQIMPLRVECVEQLEGLIAANADSLFAQGKIYKEVFDTLAKKAELMSKNCTLSPKPSNHLAHVGKETLCDVTASGRAELESKNNSQGPVPANIINPLTVSSDLIKERFRRDLPKRPKMGVENEWAAIAIRKDEQDLLQQQRELEAEREKKMLYRDELDVQYRLLELRKQLEREKERERERQILERQHKAVVEELKDNLQETQLARQAQKICANSSLEEKNRVFQIKKIKRKKEKELFNLQIERSLKKAEEEERFKEELRSQAKRELNLIYNEQKAAKRDIHEISRQNDIQLAQSYLEKAKQQQLEEERKLVEKRKCYQKYQEELKKQLRLNEERRKTRELMSEHERKLNGPIIASFRTHERSETTDPYNYSMKSREPSRNVRNNPLMHKELLIKDLNNFRSRMEAGHVLQQGYYDPRLSSSMRTVEPVTHSSILEQSLPQINITDLSADQPRRHFRRNVNYSQLFLRPYESSEVVAKSFSTLNNDYENKPTQFFSPALVNNNEATQGSTDYARPVINSKYYKNRLQTKHSHVF